MTHAYNELYLDNAIDLLADIIDYSCNNLKLSYDTFTKIFVNSKYCNLLETGNPYVISGMSGEEFVNKLLDGIHFRYIPVKKEIYLNKSPEYWAGYYLAFYQWYTGRRFKDIFDRVSLEKIISMYDVFHEMDVMHFVDAMEKRYIQVNKETKLKMFREKRGLSQRELAEASGVKLRMIQLYEQRENDINKAQVKTLDMLARVLGCDIEALMENNN